MASFNDYYTMGITIPSTILFAFYFCSAVATLILISKSRLTSKGLVYRLPRMIRLVLKNVFVELKVKEDTVTSAAAGNRYFEVYVHGKRLNRKSVFSIVVMVLNVFGCSIATLWTVLLIQEGSTCGEDGFDCFSNEERMSDCSIFENGTNVNFNGTDHQLQCYRFVVNYIGAFAAAGGITFFARIVINTLLFTFASIGDIKTSGYRVLSVLLFLVFLVVTVIGFIFLGRHLSAFDDLSIPATFTVSVYTVTLSFSIVACLQLVADLSNVSEEFTL